MDQPGADRDVVEQCHRERAVGREQRALLAVSSRRATEFEAQVERESGEDQHDRGAERREQRLGDEPVAPERRSHHELAREDRVRQDSDDVEHDEAVDRAVEARPVQAERCVGPAHEAETEDRPASHLRRLPRERVRRRRGGCAGDHRARHPRHAERRDREPQMRDLAAPLRVDPGVQQRRVDRHDDSGEQQGTPHRIADRRGWLRP